MAARQSLLRRHWLWITANLVAILPLVWLAWDTWQGNLTVNPIDDFTDRTGSGAIRLLLASLAVTPVQTVTGWRKGPKRKAKSGRSRGSIRPVELAVSVDSRTLVLVLPGGARVEGLDVSAIAELARSLA